MDDFSKERYRNWAIAIAENDPFFAYIKSWVKETASFQTAFSCGRKKRKNFIENRENFTETSPNLGKYPF
ncbi:MAG: hypothetical protein J7647_29525 [Cyanobacteria bacterium SBLK]|nr:hypothetical protein [Cyanobacteria bacterium SBLK]